MPTLNRDVLLVRRVVLLGLGVLGSLPASALYKVVGPDGSVTYTDRPPIAQNVRVNQMARSGRATPASGDSTLPPELRNAAARHPVTLYTSAECSPCDAARRYLQQRGVPYGERRVVTQEDADALERLVGGRTVPSLTIGPQPLRGYAEADWARYLDVAGYPAENRLPRGWPVPEPLPVTERAPARTAASPAPAAPPSPAPPAATTEPAAGGTTIRF
jgi:glutaredoxin